MKKILIATMLLVLAAPLFAKEFTYVACSKDQKLVGVVIDLKDEVILRYAEIPQHIATAFTKAAAELPASDFQDDAGFHLFLSYLSDVDITALPDGGLDVPSIVAPSCDAK